MSDLIPGRYQVMPDIDPETLAALKADIAKRGVVTPIDVDEHGNILDGHNRLRAWQELGKNEPPPTIVRSGMSEEEKFAFARKQNILRRHLTGEQKRALIGEQIERTPNRSDRSIAADMGVDHKTVGAARKRLREGGEIPHLDDRPPPPKRSLAAADTPEAFTSRLLGGAKAARANAAKVATLPTDLKLALFEAGLSSGSIIVCEGDARPTPTLNADWKQFVALLVSFGWDDDAANRHAEWLIRRPFVSADEWLGEDGRDWRHSQRMREPSDHFKGEWARFKTEARQ